MTRNTGNHGARLAAAKIEPSPITGLKDMLATAFAADIAAVTPMVCDVMREGILGQATPSGRHRVTEAVAFLRGHSGALAMEVAQAFRALFDSKVTANDGTSKFGSTTLFGLTLMDETGLAMELALDQCAARLREQSGAEMFHLTARVAEMLGKPSLDEANNPVAPRVFARTLCNALGKLDLDNEQRLVVFKAFGPPLLYIAPDLYGHANALLVEHGVLAEFRAGYGRPVNSHAAAAPRRRKEPFLVDESALAVILDRLLSGERRGNPAQFAAAQ